MNDYGINAIITGDSSGFAKAIQKAQQALSEFGNKLGNVTDKVSTGLKNWGVDLGKFYDKGSSIFKDFGIDVDQFASHFGMSGALMSGIVAVTVALQKLGEEVNKVSAEIAKGTGATGDALRKLENDAKDAMVNGVGLSAQEAGKAIADLNTRFGVSGKEAVSLTESFASFSRVMGGDVSGNINNVADAVKKWGLETEQVPQLLDQLTVASQASGASTSELLSELSNGQAVFSQFGMSLTESMSFLASMHAEGINASTAMTGLRTALVKISDAGLDASQGFDYVKESIKNAGTQTEALNMATEIFGTRAGAEMLRVLQSETSAVDDLTKALTESGGALKASDEASRQTADAWKSLQKALEGTFGGFGQGIDSLFADIIDSVTYFVQLIDPIVRPIGEIFREVFSFIGELLKTLVSFFVEFQQKYNTVWKSVADVLQTVYETIHSILGSVLSVVQDVFGLIFAIIDGKWELAWKYTERILLNAVKIIADALSLVVNAFVLATNGLIKAINLIVDGVNLILKPLSDLTGGFVPLLGHLNELQKVDFSDSWGITDAIETVTAEIDEMTGATTAKITGTLGEVQQTTADITGAIVGDWNTVFGTTENGANSTKTALENLSRSENTWKIKILNLEKDMAKTEQEKLDKQAEILDLEKEQALANAKTAEEAQQIDKYYGMLRDKLYDIADVQEEITDNVQADYSWTQKLKQQELSRLQTAMDSAVERAKAEGKSEEEIAKIKEKYFTEMQNKQLELLALQKEIDLARSTSAEQAYEIDTYYTNEEIALAEETAKKIAQAYAQIPSPLAPEKDSGEGSKATGKPVSDTGDKTTSGEKSTELADYFKTLADMSTEYNNKLEAQKLARIEKEKSYDLEQLKEQGASQEEIFAVNKAYTERILNMKLDALKEEKQALLDSLPDDENYAQLRADIEKYYLNEESEMRKDAYKEIEKERAKDKKNQESTWSKMMKGVSTVTSYMVSGFKTSFSAVSKLFSSIGKIISGVWSGFVKALDFNPDETLDGLLAFEDKILTFFYDTLPQLPSFLANALQSIGTLLNTLLENIDFSGLATMLADALESAVDILPSLIQGVIKVVGEVVKQLPKIIQKVMPKIISALKTIVKALPEILPDFIKGIFEMINELARSLPEVLPELIKGVIELVKALITELPTTIDLLLTGIADTLNQLFSNPDEIAKFIHVIMDSMGKIAKSLLENAGVIFGALIEILPDVLMKILVDLPSILGKIFEGAWNGVIAVLKGTVNALIKGVNFITQGLSMAWTWLGIPAIPKIPLLAKGTDNAQRGLAIVGEAGPELVNFRGGEQVLSNKKTNEALSGNKTNNFNVTFNNVSDTSAYALVQQLKRYNREMAFNGVL